MSPFFHPNFIFLIVSIISIVGGAILVTKLPDFVTPWTVTHKAPLPTGSPKARIWSGLPFPSSGDLPDSRIKHSLPLCPQGSPHYFHFCSQKGCVN